MIFIIYSVWYGEWQYISFRPRYTYLLSTLTLLIYQFIHPSIYPSFHPIFPLSILSSPFPPSIHSSPFSTFFRLSSSFLTVCLSSLLSSFSNFINPVWTSLSAIQWAFQTYYFYMLNQNKSIIYIIAIIWCYICYRKNFYTYASSEIYNLNWIELNTIKRNSFDLKIIIMKFL